MLPAWARTSLTMAPMSPLSNAIPEGSRGPGIASSSSSPSIGVTATVRLANSSPKRGCRSGRS